MEPLTFADRGLALLAFASALFLLVGAIGWWAEKRTEAERRSLPAPDDPRLRNYLSEKAWRQKRALMKRRWVA